MNAEDDKPGDDLFGESVCYLFIWIHTLTLLLFFQPKESKDEEEDGDIWKSAVGESTSGIQVETSFIQWLLNFSL